MNDRPIEIRGYAAITGQRNRGATVFRPGAFAKNDPSGSQIPVFWQRNGSKGVGTLLDAKEDAHGLAVRILLDGEFADEALNAVQSGSCNGLSISFSRRTYREKDGVEYVSDVALSSVRLVPNPIHPEARVRQWIEPD